ncbi:MAG: rRNA maturation RNase YbeY [Bacteroidota bacterium]
MQTIQFRSADRTFSMAGKTAIKSFVATIFKKEKRALASITYVFCSDAFLLQMNRDFLQHDYYTDIITFGLSEKGEPVEAEVYISLDRVRDNAKTLGTAFKAEALRVIFHGALHLCGYKDKKKSEILLMRQKEDHYLRLFEKQAQ